MKSTSATGDIDIFRELLRAKGLKATQQRLAVLTVLKQSSKPLSLSDLEASPPLKTINQSTLYRAVHDCVDAGIIRSVDLRHTHAHYELVPKEDHHHLICISCGIVEDFAYPRCATVIKNILAKSTMFSSTFDHSFEVYGRCRRCSG